MPDAVSVMVCPLAQIEDEDEAIDKVGEADKETLTVAEELPQALETLQVYTPAEFNETELVLAVVLQV